MQQGDYVVEIKEKFRLSDNFLNQFKGKQPDWGPIGYVTYKRCVTIDTPILTRDLRWISSGDIKEGEEIISFDEYSSNKHKGRCLRIGKVIHNSIEEADCVEIELSNGEKLYSTPDHPWLVKKASNQLIWVEAQHLLRGKTKDCYMLKYFNMWEEDKSYEGGYLAAAFDGEGCLDRHRSLSFCQDNNEMLDKVREYLEKFKFKYYERIGKERINKKGEHRIRHDLCISGADQVSRFLGMFRPKRLLAKYLSFQDEMQLKRQKFRNKEEICVVSVKHIGKRKVAILSTSTKTHFTGGYPSHNTYARSVGDEDRLEEFWETLKRVVEGCYTIQLNHCKGLRLHWNAHKAQKSAQEMYNLMWKMKFLPPGRGLWAMGTDVVWKKGGACLNNCAFASTSEINEHFSDPFIWIMDMSMFGVGCGFDTLGAGKIKVTTPKTVDAIHICDDSREGWCDIVRIILDGYVGKAKIPEHIDYSEIRPSGAPIKTFGGIAPGPGPLIECVDTLKQFFNERIGKEITSTDIVDLMDIVGRCVVSGGVRRTALLALGSHTDTDYMSMKDPEEHAELMTSWRWASNNSIYATVGMDYNDLAAQTAKNGEPGYVWMENIRKYGRLKDGPTYEDEAATGINPCVTGNTRILTKEFGYTPIISVIGIPVNVWNGSVWSSVIPRKTGDNQDIFLVKLDDGTELNCTAYHGWMIKNKGKIETTNLDIGDKLEKFNMPILQYGDKLNHAYTQGFFTGDGQGSGTAKGALLYGIKQQLVNILEGTSTQKIDKYDRFWIGFPNDLKDKYYVPIDKSLDSRLDWLAGLLDADGCLVEYDNGSGLQLTNINKEFLNELRLLLTTMGVQAKVKNESLGGMGFLPDGKGGYKEYMCNPTYRLLINCSDTTLLYSLGMKTYRIIPSKLSPNRDSRRFVKISSVEKTDRNEDVYCFNEPINHTGCFEGIITANCAEQTLESFEMCNLVETFPSRHDSAEEYRRTLKYAYLYAKTVTLVPTHSERTNQVLLRNRRIGLSMSGIVDAMYKFGRRTYFNDFCDSGYEYVRDLDKIYSRWLCIPTSIKCTTTKPSGTVSLLAGVSPGIHWPHAKYYIRRMEVQDTNPIVGPLKEAGYPFEKSVYKSNSLVFEFPISQGDFIKSKADITIWEQLELHAAIQYYWSDNNVSQTVNFNPDTEMNQIADALSSFEDRIKAISFLPMINHRYQQAPYEEIDWEEYESRASQINNDMDLTNVGNGHYEDDAKEDLRKCSSEGCLIKEFLDKAKDLEPVLN